MKKNRFLAIAATAASLALAGGSTLAQNAPPPPPDGGDVMYEAMGPGPGGPPDAIAFVAFEGDVGGKTVTGAPFTASFNMQTTQTLADGNQIQRTTTGTLARDSQGRVRRDVTLPAIGPWAASGKAPQMTFINDPVASVRYTLNANNKTARQSPMHNRGSADFAKKFHGGPMAAEREKGTTTTSLGTQMINGVSAEGTRITRTIPANEIGNAKPIVVTVEKWYSPELQETVMTKRSDPRFGDTVRQLTNIQRAEPAANLFQVPADYTMKQGGGFGRRGMHRHMGPGAPAGDAAPAAPSSPTP